MKILVVHPSVELYGADKILLYVLGFLADENEVTVLLPKDGTLVGCIRESFPSVSVVIEESLPIVHSRLGIFGFMRLPFLFYKANRLFKKNAFDCIYCNTLATVLFLYSRWSKVRIAHVHEIIENKILNFGFSVLLRIRTKKVICVSEHVKNALLFSRRYAVLHNGIPDVCRKPMVNNANKKLRFVLPGRYMPKKGQWFLIDALKLIPKEKLAETEFYLYGSPPPASPEFEEQLKKAISDAELESTIFLHGFEQDIAEVYGHSDVVIVPSIMSDPFPTTVLESMMFSRPVITTDNGGASEIVKDSFGILVYPGDTVALAKAVLYFLENRNAVIKMGTAARKEYESKLTLEIFENNFLLMVMDSFAKCVGMHDEHQSP